MRGDLLSDWSLPWETQGEWNKITNLAMIRLTVQGGMHFKGFRFQPPGGKPTKNAFWRLLLDQFSPNLYHETAYFWYLPTYTPHMARWWIFLEEKWAKDHPIRLSSSHSMPVFLQQSRGSIGSAFSSYAMITNSFLSWVIGRLPIYGPDFVEEKLE